VLLRVAGGALMLAAILWYSQLIDAPTAWLVFAGIVAASATLFREFFRMVLMTHHRPQEVLKADTLYVAVLVGGALLATLSPYPAIVAVITLSVAAGVGGLLLSRALWRFEAWNPLGKKATLAEIAPIGGWATVGAALHWAFSQGYNYLAAGMLSVASVGALASTRLLLTPLNLLSSGIGSLMLPTASQWLRDHGAETVFRRLLLVSGLLAGASLCYIGVIWYFRDWVFMHVLKKQFEDQDVLLIVWSAVFVLMLFRDQLLQLPSASGRFRQLAVVTAISTLIALTISYVAIRRFGVIGAPLGVLFGELSNLVGIGLLSAREIRDSRSIDKRTE
jgi:O-antigen/teichoic acid export membrane protein